MQLTITKYMFWAYIVAIKHISGDEMLTVNRMSQVFNSAKEITFDDTSKFILMSDVHRGTKSGADNFAHNENIFIQALNYYYNKGFSYIEIGDGDELWENRYFSNIFFAYQPIFKLLNTFYMEKRFYSIFGNHDMVKKFSENRLIFRSDNSHDKQVQLFNDIKHYEGLILNYKEMKKIFVVHGHQGDLINDKFWNVARFLVRYVWKPLEIYFGIQDPTSPAKNYRKKRSTEKKIAHWAEINQQMMITGHTHRPMFSANENALYFNTGSCVHPKCITGIEIEKGVMQLIKWCLQSGCIVRKVISKPLKL